MKQLWKIIKSLCCIALVFMVLPVYAQENILKIKAGPEKEQIVRVRLTRLGERERLDLTFTAPYQLESDHQTTMYFQAGSQVTFQIHNDLIYLYYQGMGQKLGKSILLLRTAEIAGPLSGFQITNFPALYTGDLRLDIIDGHFRPVLNIHVEDYLLGVLPYEMGDGFPLEALKAQAVAARTYALKQQGQYKDYDLVDNTNDQAFKGYLPGNPRSEKAVLETRGICGSYRGELAQCYYSASNGGQTELVQDVWPSRKTFDYYAFGEDPYDIANPESVVRRYKLLKEYSEEKTAPHKFQKMVVEFLADTLQKQGYQSTDDNVRIDRIVSVSADKPSSQNSRHMTNLHMLLEISVRPNVIDTDLEDVYLFDQTSALKERIPTGMADVSDPVNLPFVPLGEQIAIDVPIFPVAEEAFALDISSNYENEIWCVVEEENEFVIEARRYGHGVGMSQRGAQWMASEYDKTYQEILSFYYPGMGLIQFPEQERNFARAEEALSAVAGPAPTPTPRPTLMPISAQLNTGEWYAAVTEIADDSSLNLRAEPSLNAQILMRLYKGQRLIVIQKAEDGWVHVKTDSAEGYVLEKYLTKEHAEK